jgi:hypothetical protein
MSGEWEKPLVIGKAAKPRCFKNMDVTKFGVDWKSNRKAWMTREIMMGWLEHLDRKMIRQSRKVLLFLDNAASHPDVKLQNVKIVFLPPNVTSVSQPLDQGVIQNFKIKYRQLVMKHIVSQLDRKEVTLQTLTKELNVFQAVTWITNAWKQVTVSTIRSCFLKAGFPANNDICDMESEIPDSMEVTQKLIHAAGYNVGANSYIDIDLNIPTECESQDTHTILQSVQDKGGENEDQDDDDDENGGDDNNDIELVSVADVPPVASYGEALDIIERLKEFYQSRKDESGIKLAQDLIVHNEHIIAKPRCTKQTNIKDYISSVN